MSRAVVVLLAVGLVVAACKKTENHVDLVLGASGLHGFHCRTEGPDSTALVNRAIDAGVAAIVVDFIEFQGVPGCRSAELSAWCTEDPERCTIVRRECFDVEGFTGTLDDFVSRVTDELAQVSIEDAPDGPVMVRVVGVADSCASVEVAGMDFACADLIGCSHTCPVVLDDVRGDLTIALDTLGNTCEHEVQLCASSDFAAGQAMCR